MNVPERFRGPDATAEINAMIVAAIGVFMVGSGTADIGVSLQNRGVWEWHCVMPLFIVLSGMVLILFPHMRARFAAPLAAGTYTIANIVVEAEHIYNSILTIHVLTIFTSVAILIGAIQFAVGYRHGTARMLALLLIQFVLILPVLFAVVVIVPRFMEMDVVSYDILFYAMFLTALIFYLLRPGVRDDSFDRRINLGMRTVSSLLSTSSGALVYRDDVEAVTGEDRSSWCEAEGGRILTHTSHILDENRKFELVSEIWDGEGKIRISVKQLGASQYMATSFVLKGHSVEDCGSAQYLRLYGEGGFFIRLLIADRPGNGRKLEDSVSDDAVEEAEIEKENALDPV